MPKHALLSASASHRWLNCPPSAKLCADIKDEASPYAKQGTDAHSLCEFKVLTALGQHPPDPTDDLDYFDQEMAYCTDEYCSYVMEQLTEAKTHCKDPQVLVEQRLDFSKWVPEGFGTGDCLIVADDALHIIDFKYGLGVLVEAEDNPQMMCYALGALDIYDGIYDITSVKMTIFQPRRENVSTFTIKKEDLLKWADDFLKPTAELAFNGEGEFKAGDHCTFCKAKATCRKRAEYNLELAKYDFEMPASLSETEIAAILPKIDDLTAWAADIKESGVAFIILDFLRAMLISFRTLTSPISKASFSSSIDEAYLSSSFLSMLSQKEENFLSSNISITALKSDLTVIFTPASVNCCVTALCIVYFNSSVSTMEYVPLSTTGNTLSFFRKLISIPLSCGLTNLSI